MLYVGAGRFRLVEMGIDLPVGAFVGELGLLAPDGRLFENLAALQPAVAPTDAAGPPDVQAALPPREAG